MEHFYITQGAVPAQPGYIAHFIESDGEIWRRAVAAWLIQHEREVDGDEFLDARPGQLIGTRVVAGVVAIEELDPVTEWPQFLVVTDPLDDVEAVVRDAVDRRRRAEEAHRNRPTE